MAHPDPLPNEVLDHVAVEIGDLLQRDIAVAPGGRGMAPLSAEGNELGETLAVWMLGQDAAEQANTESEFRSALRNTAQWHHQIIQDGEPRGFAWSAPTGPRAGDWKIGQIGPSPLAAKIESAMGWLDARVEEDAVARLLVVPSYYLHAIWLAYPNGTSKVLVVSKPEKYQHLEYERLYDSYEFLNLLRQEEAAAGVPASPPRDFGDEKKGRRQTMARLSLEKGRRILRIEPVAGGRALEEFTGSDVREPVHAAAQKPARKSTVRRPVRRARAAKKKRAKKARRKLRK